MQKTPIILLVAAVSLGASLYGSAQDSPKPAPAPQAKDAAIDISNRVAASASWDDDFLYLLLQVNKPTLTGKNTKPFSNPIEDDAVIVSLQTDNDHKTTLRTGRTYSMAVSAMGGTQLYIGEKATPLYKGIEEDFAKRLEAIQKEEKDPEVQQRRISALLGTLIKFAHTPQGAKRPIGANAPGYTVELAIPWSDLGGKPQNDARMGFNIVAQSIGAGSPPLQSLNRSVQTPADTENPSLWGEIAFQNAPAASKPNLVIASRVFANKPVIDGDLGNGEWNALGIVAFGEKGVENTAGGASAATLAARVRPAYTPRPTRPAVPLSPAVANPPAAPARKSQALTPFVFATYRYDYQGDPRKAIPTQNVAEATGRTLLPLHPREGTGPGLSYDRADWHRSQLLEARSSGIDVVLPIYRGDARSKSLYADKGLMVLAVALESLRNAGLDYPQVGLSLDASALAEILGAQPDLKDSAALTALYISIRDFYRHIPEAFRCTVALSPENGGGKAHPVFLSAHANSLDAAGIASLRARFRADFDGADLLLIGDAAAQGKAPFDGFFAEAKEKGAGFQNGGWISIATVSAGYDNAFTRLASEAPQKRPFREGQTYRSDWAQALSKKPSWVVIDGWNDYVRASSVAPTIEYGIAASDLTRLYTRIFTGDAKIGIKTITHDIPAQMSPRASYAAQVRVQNTGVLPWLEKQDNFSSAIAFGYRWKRSGGDLVASSVPIPLKNPVFARANETVSLSIQASDSGGAALPAGDYLLEFGAYAQNKTTRKMEWIGGADASPALVLPVKIGSAANSAGWAATLVRSDLPRTPETGSVYDISATLRNDGAQVWKPADGARVGLRLYRVDPAMGGRAETETLVSSADASAPLEKEVAPGEATTVKIPFPLLDGAGNPLPVWTQDQPWRYLLRWEVSANPQGANIPGVLFAPTPLAITDFDFGVRFVEDATPPTLPAERRLPVRLSIRNTGSQIWKAQNVRIGYHWRYQDGTELIWEDESTPLPQDLAPGETLRDFLAYVTAPAQDGNYWLTWDVKFGDTWASTTASARAFDQSLRSVRVIGGKLLFADLSKSYNLDGIADDDSRADGNFDGEGRTFPADALPPFAEMPIAPSTLWLTSPRIGPESPRRIAFRLGSKEPKANNFLSCKGQRLDLGASSGPCRLLHILAASSSKNVATTLALVFQEPNGESEDQYAFTVSRWDQPPAKNEEVAFVSRRHQTKDGLQEGSVALYHYVIRIRDPRKLMALRLPDAPDIKIAALTLEK